MQSKTTAKDFFLCLGVIIGLYVSAISFLTLVFQIINKIFPLAGEYAGGFDNIIRSSLAALIIFFPAFIYITFISNKDLIVSPEKKDIWIRRWSIFLTLFIAGLTVAIDLSTLIYRFLGAEDLTLRFFLKVFFVLAVAITIFRFTLKDLKRTSFEMTKNQKISTGIISAIILVVVVLGIITIGSPASQRAKMMDEQRINDLSNIQSQIVYMQWENKGTVPASLDALKDPISNYVVPTDPETKANYEYKMLSKNSFELCATFKTIVTAPTNVVGTKPVSNLYGADVINENWQHQATTTCFTRTIDPNVYKVNPVK